VVLEPKPTTNLARFTDITGDGKPELVCICEATTDYAGQLGDPSQPWKFHPISPNNNYGNFTHGMGVGPT